MVAFNGDKHPDETVVNAEIGLDQSLSKEAEQTLFTCQLYSVPAAKFVNT